MLVLSGGKFTAFPDSGADFYTDTCLFDEILTNETRDGCKGSEAPSQCNKALLRSV
jgi:hypothetical protein